MSVIVHPVRLIDHLCGHEKHCGHCANCQRRRAEKARRRLREAVWAAVWAPLERGR